MSDTINRNMLLWDKVCETDPDQTKKGKKGQYEFTSIAPYYQFKKATKMFGPQGIGWGVKIGSEVFTETQYDTTTILSYDAILFFKMNPADVGEIPIHASEKAAYQTQGGYYKIDDEVRKKVVTNAKTKGLSELGFSADVFMGMFDDPNYVDYRRAEEYIERSDNKEEALAEKKNELLAWLKKEVGIYPTLSNMHTMGNVYEAHRQKLESLCKIAQEDPAKYIRRLDEAYFEQEKAIKEKESEQSDSRV